MCRQGDGHAADPESGDERRHVDAEVVESDENGDAPDSQNRGEAECTNGRDGGGIGLHSPAVVASQEEVQDRRRPERRLCNQRELRESGALNSMDVSATPRRFDEVTLPEPSPRIERSTRE